MFSFRNESVKEFKNKMRIYLEKYCNENPIIIVRDKLLQQETPWDQIRIGQLALLTAICEMQTENFEAIDWENNGLHNRARALHHILIQKVNAEKYKKESTPRGVIHWDISLDTPSNPVAIPDYLITSEYAADLLAENKTLLTIENCLPYFPKNPDVVAEIIRISTAKLIKELKLYPTESQVWITLRTNPPKGYSIRSFEESDEEHISIAGQKLGRKAFKKRWHKYTTPNKSSA